MKPTVLLLLLLLVSPSYVSASAQDNEGVSLQQALLDVVRAYGVPLSAELEEPAPTRVLLILKKDESIAQALDRILLQCPEYAWAEVGGVYLVQAKHIRAASGNPFNQRLPSFSVPAKFGLFRFVFPTAVISATKHERLQGYALSGLGQFDEGPKLHNQVFSNETARDILLAVGRQVGPFYSLLRLPSTTAERKKVSSNAFLGWEVVAGPTVETYKLHTTPLPREIGTEAR